MKNKGLCWVRTDGKCYIPYTEDGYGSNVHVYKNKITFTTLNYAWVVNRTSFKVIDKIDIRMMV